MSEQGRYHGGLVIFGQDHQMLDRFSRVVAATLEDYGHPVERNTLCDSATARVTATHYAVTLTLIKGAKAPDAPDKSDAIVLVGEYRARGQRAADRHMRLQLDIVAADPARDDPDISELLLVVMLYRMTGISDVRLVEWLDAKTTMSCEQFLDAFATLSPGLVRGQDDADTIANPRFAPIDDTARILESRAESHRRENAQAMADDTDAAGDGPVEQVSDIQRLAVWMMTGVIAFVSMPVAVSMAGVNLVRGEDFRLNTHVLALTAFLATLQSSGVLASAVARLPI